MKKDFCTHCGAQTPACAIVSLSCGDALERIAHCQLSRQQAYPVCHNNAMQLDGESLRIIENCDDCGLCQITCPGCSFVPTKSDLAALEPVVLQSVHRLAILINGLYPDSIAACEGKARGNARTKRIDLVIRHGNQLLLVKVLTKLEKLSFYHRSYQEVCESYRAECSQGLAAIMLVPSAQLAQARNICPDAISLAELIDYLGEKHVAVTEP